MNGPRLSSYCREDLRKLLQPQSIAVIGASSNPSSLGARTLANLAGFSGAVYPVNQRYRRIGPRRCYASLSALPRVPDCAVIAVPMAGVEAALHECVVAGVGAAVIYASGYSETGTPEGIAAQQRLVAIGRNAGLRIVGPNCTGIAALERGVHAAFAEFPIHGGAQSRMVGLVSQSGALGLALSQATRHGVPISHVLTAGNSCDVDVADYVSVLAEDPSCAAIALVFEGLDGPERFAHAALRARSAGKYVVAFKLATSPAGAEAALHHTGSRAGSVPECERIFSACRIVAVDRVETLLETAAFFAKAPESTRAGVAVISSSGGTAILAADCAARHGVAMPQPADDTVAALRAAIPDFGAARNPCDATARATGNPESLLGCAEAMLSDPRYGALVVPWGRTPQLESMAHLADAARRHGKAVCIVWMSQHLEGSGAAEAAADPSLALFRSMDACFAALAAWQRA